MPRAGYIPDHTHDDPTIKGLDLAVTELNGMIRSLDEGARQIVQTETEAMWRDAVGRWNGTAGQSRRNRAGRGGLKTTYRSGRYREAIRRIFFDELHTGKVFVAPQHDDRGARAKNLPIWLEYSTLRMDAREHLIPALKAARVRFDAAMARLLAAFPKG